MDTNGCWRVNGEPEEIHWSDWWIPANRCKVRLADEIHGKLICNWIDKVCDRSTNQLVGKHLAKCPKDKRRIKFFYVPETKALKLVGSCLRYSRSSMRKDDELGGTRTMNEWYAIQCFIETSTNLSTHCLSVGRMIQKCYDAVTLFREVYPHYADLVSFLPGRCSILNSHAWFHLGTNLTILRSNLLRRRYFNRFRSVKPSLSP